MSHYLMLHYGFETPTPEIMKAWGQWFGSIGDKMVGGGQFPTGHEFSHDGSQDLSLGPGAITGYNIIEADSLEEAAKIAEACPFIDSIRVYEVNSMGG